MLSNFSRRGRGDALMTESGCELALQLAWRRFFYSPHSDRTDLLEALLCCSNADVQKTVVSSLRRHAGISTDLKRALATGELFEGISRVLKNVLQAKDHECIQAPLADIHELLCRLALAENAGLDKSYDFLLCEAALTDGPQAPLCAQTLAKRLFIEQLWNRDGAHHAAIVRAGALRVVAKYSPKTLEAVTLLAFVPPPVLCAPENIDATRALVSAHLVPSSGPLPLRVVLDCGASFQTHTIHNLCFELALDGHWPRLASWAYRAGFRYLAASLCFALQPLRLPALLTLLILDELLDNNERMWLKWELVTRVKHFHDRT